MEQTTNFKPLNLDDHKNILQRIRDFESELSQTFNQPVSVVAYSSQPNAEDLGHS